MATTLIDAMTATFDATAFEDHYREKLVGLIEARAAGRAAPRAKGKPRAPTNVVDLESILRKSLEHTRAAATATATRKRAPTTHRTAKRSAASGKRRPHAA